MALAWNDLSERSRLAQVEEQAGRPLTTAYADLGPEEIPVWDDAHYAARRLAWQAFVRTLGPLARAATTALGDRVPSSLAGRSLPCAEQALDEAVAAWQEFRAVLEAR